MCTAFSKLFPFLQNSTQLTEQFSRILLKSVDNMRMSAYFTLYILYLKSTASCNSLVGIQSCTSFFAKDFFNKFFNSWNTA